jgi:ubiquinone/menaquinone biosynthesis C-methylase UbiE
MNRFARTADLMAARQDARQADLERDVRAFVQPRGDVRALDVGTGVGALALALAPHVAEVVGVDAEPELLERARERAPANATFLLGDAGVLPLEDGAFDLAATMRTLHHLRRPELALAELARVTRPGGRILVIDQLAPADPLQAFAVDRFERARTPDHERLLSDQFLRQLLEANDLVLVRERRVVERRDVAAFLDLAGCEGEAREQALALAPEGLETFTAEIGWYLAARP